MGGKEQDDYPCVIKIVDYTISICRVCTLNTKCQNIFNMSYSDLTFADLFYYSTRIQLSVDDNPYHICLMCVGKLLNAYEFIIQCEKSWYAQKQVRMSAQLEISPNPAVPNIIIVDSNDINISDTIAQPNQVVIPKYYKPIAPKPSDPLVDSTNSSKDTAQNPLQKVILVKNQDGMIEGSVRNVESQENKSASSIQKGRRSKTNYKNTCKASQIILQKEQVIIISDDMQQRYENPMEIAEVVMNKEDRTECNQTTNPTCSDTILVNSAEKITHENAADVAPIATEVLELSESDNESDIFKDILEELAEAEIDSNYEGSDDLTEDEGRKEKKEEGSKPPYKCVKCGREFQKIHSLNRHLLWHLSGGYCCSACGEEFSSQQNLKKHMQVHATKGRMVCEHCGKIFKAEIALRNHQRRQHSQRNRPEGSVKTIDETDQLCNVCGKTFFGLAKLRKHMVVHDERRRVTCVICSKTFCSRESLRQHIYTHTGVKPYQCHICGKRCAQSQQLKAHIRVHTGDKPYSCNYCENSFSTSASLVTHIRARHTNVRPHVCEVCGKGFIQKPALTKHLKTHSHAMPKSRNGNYTYSVSVACTLCGIIFPSRGELLAHECANIHLAPYTCEVCGKRFRVKHLLTVHMRIHTGERPFKCKFCLQTFRSQGSLKEHTYRHTGEKKFVCDICGKGCTQRQQLVSHMRIHTGVKPYKCDICEKAFSMKGNLTVHMRTHTGETPYRCDDCGAAFYASNALRRHRIKCAGQNNVIVYENIASDVIVYAEPEQN